MCFLKNIIPIFFRSSVEVSKELRLSPKKQSQAKYSTVVNTKSSQIRKTVSPNSKKVTNCRSPNGKKISSPQLSTTIANIPISNTNLPLQDSNAIQTAKKLKRILESSSLASDADESKNLQETTSKRLNLKKQPSTRPIKKQKRFHDDSVDRINECKDQRTSNQREDMAIEHVPNEVHTESTEIITWSRDEDRLLLEQIKNGLDNNIENITDISHQFPNKTTDHIRERIGFLIDFLTKLRDRK